MPVEPEMYDSGLFRFLDRIAFNRIARFRSPFGSPEASKIFFERLEKDFKSDDTLLGLSFGLFTALDTKTSALLTHISVLTAVVAVLYSNANSYTLYKYLLGAEILAYLFSTILCLRCIRFALPNPQGDLSHAGQAYQEIEKKRAVLSLASDITVCATVFLMILFVVLSIL